MKALARAGMTAVAVDVAAQTVSFDGDRAEATRTLSRLGYPEAGSSDAGSMSKKAVSYGTCAVGTVGEGVRTGGKRPLKFWLLIGVPVVLACIAVLLAGAAWRSLSSTHKINAAQSSTVVNLKDGDTYTLTASYVTKDISGVQQKMLAYNGMIPGPEIHVAQGAQVTIDFKNETDMPALLHSHGVRMDNASDGSQLQQKEISPGGSYRYVLKFPDAGVFWYHPHASEVYQQALGLYGAFVVAPAVADYYPPVNSEHVLFLSDLPVKDGHIAIQKEGDDYSLMGHYGNVFLVNGEEHYTLAATVGEVVRLDIVNAANARPFRFAIEGAKLKLIGSDNGAYERATWQNAVTLGPSERAIIDVMFAKASTYAIRNATPEGTDMLGTVEVRAGTVSPSYASQYRILQANASVSANIDPFRPYFDGAPDKKLTLAVDFTGMMAGHMQMMGGMGHMGSMHSMGMGGSADGIEWNDSDGMMQMMNAMATAAETKWKITDAATGKSNMDIDWDFARGTPVKIEIYNDPNSMHPMQHPVHFHGQRFLMLSIDGVRQTNLAWKDTVFVPAGATVDILLDPSNPGTWMAHCHISEHLAAGMMFSFRVQ
jgi:FtsP/CotA-like multicopper oxidase with cupredoxin domain